jgi:hypothetical protein
VAPNGRYAVEEKVTVDAAADRQHVLVMANMTVERFAGAMR